MEYAMRAHISYAALGLVLAGAPAAHAQTVITPEIITPPVQTVQTTTETVRTTRMVGSVRGMPRHQVVTTRTVTQRVIPATTTVSAVTAAPRPLYDVAAPLAGPDDYASAPLYDVAAPAPVVGPAPAVVPAAAVIGTAPIIYRYVYEPDRILVIDPTTGVAIQALPR
jgi:hypothetical protein